jgi:hypothetical protein
MEINADTIKIITTYVLPGFISLKVWSFISPSEKRHIQDIILELVIYSLLNYIIMNWLVTLALQSGNEVFINLSTIFVSIVTPIIWPIIIKNVIDLKLLRGKIIHPTKSAWDFFFSKAKPCFALVHLKDKRKVGGLFYDQSFASSMDEAFDIYIMQVWEIKDGRFIKPIKGSLGIWLNSSVIEFIEFFDAQKKEEKINE